MHTYIVSWCTSPPYHVQPGILCTKVLPQHIHDAMLSPRQLGHCCNRRVHVANTHYTTQHTTHHNTSQCIVHHIYLVSQINESLFVATIYYIHTNGSIYVLYIVKHYNYYTLCWRNVNYYYYRRAWLVLVCC